MQAIHLNNITKDRLTLQAYVEKNIQVDVLRLDKIHPLVSGNKWFKLRYYLEEAKSQDKKKIVTYGGAWSNHILATAAASAINEWSSTGIIRGERAGSLSPTLLQAEELGMRLLFISRSAYRAAIIPEEFNSEEYYFIPEGGYGIKGAEGAATILEHCKKEKYTHICCAAGTGTMTAGLTRATVPSTRVISVSVLKNNFDLEEKVKQVAGENINPFQVIHGYHFGGYAKYNSKLVDFMNELYRQSAIPSDFIYTGKLFFAVNDLIIHNFFPRGSTILLVHSGGLQGNASLRKGTLIF
ncbi:MAG: 1-aminocyclopropane-1-carboxylate deaminase [Ferruginibacter sp.]|nr:1-aminocyclopropane-1-carboxylate deaminase [Chitinophagaceae bacterium]